MTTHDSLLEFPTKFPIKIFGLDTPAFTDSIQAIIERHVKEEDQMDWSQQLSNKGTYLAITITIMARSKAQLDAIYKDLTSNSHVKMAL